MWVVIILGGSGIVEKVYGPFQSQEVAEALARGIGYGGTGMNKSAQARSMESP